MVMTYKIELKKAYIGKPSNSQVIEAGVYNSDDPRLFGLADYLVANGHSPRIIPFSQVEGHPDYIPLDGEVDVPTETLLPVEEPEDAVEETVEEQKPRRGRPRKE